ncbi:TIGR01777 family oxidoreductase [Agriterribacter sp.]|uniref:TIGR01777 family oxidoreductase n=1 Tax=Agriterribacter sp. TaxID=2821509 RepID=UPI002C92D17F|nr:TIGR01777 family oxidoreductase [Agriterribacter sp.]HRO48351.1 TIGR01777 family oxidoreductase [Agriterribacter sp.]HRQ19551.1 TIGR01777 family oxidoreductase [Agriterribacter sp.]
MTTVLITGGTGLIGNRLTGLLIEKGYRVIILTRNKKEGIKNNASNPSYATWDPAKAVINIAAVQEADYIINLAGAGIADKRWTAKRKTVIAESRVKSGELIVKALKENANKVKAVINASAMGWYGDDSLLKKEAHAFTENMPAAPGFLGETCKAWEESIEPVTSIGKRLVKIRTGLVLSTKGGALREFTRPVRFGIAAILGSGKQMQSWIHIDDICRIYIHAIENEQLHGAYNAVAPKPVDNKSLVTDLAKKMKGSFYIVIYVPTFILKWMLGEMSAELLKGITLDGDKIRATGFRFLFPSLEAALNDLV